MGSKLNFFTDFKKTFELLENQGRADALVQMRQISAQLHAELEEYKTLINNSFDLFWDKRNQYNQLLADAVNSPSLNPEQYKQIANQFKQLECDIKALSDFIKQVNPEEIIVDYENRLRSLNKT